MKPNLNFCVERKKSQELTQIEMVCIELKDKFDKTFNLWCPYVPPEKPELMKDLCNQILEKKPKNLILVGDLNAKSYEWNNEEENRHGKILENCMSDNQLICVNDGQYTRRNSRSVIDLAIISKENYHIVLDCTTLTHEKVQSDHIAILLQLDFAISKEELNDYES